MRFSLSGIVACLAGLAVASPINAHTSNGEATIIAREETGVDADVKFLQATMAKNFLIEQPIVGTPLKINNFIAGLDFQSLKQILADDYGYPFCLYFYDVNSGTYLGSLCGHFNTEYKVIFDENDSRLPSGSRKPGIPPSRQLAPQPVRVTASASQSQTIIESGKVSEAMLRELLGADYGKPFIIIIEGENSGGEADGSVTSGGQIVFDPATSIPEPAKPEVKPVTVYANEAQSEQIINAGTVSYKLLRELLGNDYGKPFVIIIQGRDSGGEADGYFNADGTVVFTSETNIPEPTKPVTVYANEQQSEEIINAGTVSDKLLREILGKNYGRPFTIIIQGRDSGGEVDGYFKGDGTVVFSPETNIPDAPKQKQYTATEAQSNEIIKNGQISDAMIRQILGSDYGKTGTSFVIIVQGSSSGGEIDFTFGPDGKVIFDDTTNIPKPPTSPDPEAPPGANGGSVSFNLTGNDLKKKLNSLSYEYILNATGGKYGEFYINFSSADGKTTGYISGNIQANGAYSYKWATKTRS